MKHALIGLVIFSACATQVHAQAGANFISRLYAAHPEEMAKLKTQTIGKSATPKTLPIPPASAEQKEVAQLASDLFNANSPRAMIAIKNGQILFEGYKAGFDNQSLMLGTSVSKSLVSVAIGMALCSGKIKSLDDTAGQYVSGLTSPALKPVTIRQLLTMTSGSGDSWTIQSTFPINIGYAYGKRYILDDLNAFTNDYKGPNNRFAYSDHNANLLGLVLEGATGQPFATYVHETVWSAMGAEADALIMTDHQGRSASAGFVWATARDWARLGLFVGDQLQGDKATTCLGQYLQEATRKQTATDMGEAADRDTGYGYLMWTNSPDFADGAVVFKGARGQRVSVDPKTRSVLVTLGTDAGWIRPAYWRTFSALRELK